MIELTKPDFVVGKEERFFNFIKGLNDKDKIALISHTDLDGIVAAKVANEVLNADFIRLVNYEDLNDDLIAELKDKKVKRAVFCDLATKDGNFFKAVEKVCEVLIIDHHKILGDLNSERTTLFSADGFCASYLVYYLFSKLQNLEKNDWLVACACVADWMYVKNKDWMSKVYEKYGDEFVLDENGMAVGKGKIFSSQWTISLAAIYFGSNLSLIYNYLTNDISCVEVLKKYADEVEAEIDSYVRRFDEEKTVIGNRIFFEMKPKFAIKSMVINEISRKILDKTLIFVNCDSKNCYISARRQDGKEDLDVLLRKLVSGFEDASAGGHVKASGANFPLKYREELKKRLEKV